VRGATPIEAVVFDIDGVLVGAVLKSLAERDSVLVLG
jgi:hypothetical protein